VKVFQRRPRGALRPDDFQMSIIEHLEALRRVLIVSIAAWALTTIVAWFFADPIYAFLVHRANLQGGHTIYLNPTGAFFIRLKIALYTGLAIASPVLLQQIWSFVSPGLYLNERRLFGPLIFASVFFFALGMAFAFFSIPLIMRVLNGFADTSVMQPLFDANEFLGFVLGLIIGYGLVFELPVVIFVLGRIGLISSKWLWSNRPYWFLGLGLLANFLTPGGDPFTPLIMFVPLYLFYEGSTLLLRLTGR
jgi:sec-independent protein translocase protein TatC